MTDTLQPGVLVFHPDQGHCKVVGEKEEVLLRIPTRVMELVTLAKVPQTIRVPLTEASRLSRLRPLVAKDAVEEKLTLLSEPAGELSNNEEERIAAYKGRFQEGSFEGLLTLLRDVHKLRKAMAISPADKKAMDQAKVYVVQELMLVLDIPKLQARRMVETALKTTKKETKQQNKGS